MSCVNCGRVKRFPVDADVTADMAPNSAEAKEIKGWEPDAFVLSSLEFEGLCPDCRFNKAA